MMEMDPNSARCIVWATVGDFFFVFSILLSSGGGLWPPSELLFTYLSLFTEVNWIGLIYKILDREASDDEISPPEIM